MDQISYMFLTAFEKEKKKREALCTPRRRFEVEEPWKLHMTRIKAGFVDECNFKKNIYPETVDLVS